MRYVGKCNSKKDVEQKYNEHIEGNISEWTKKYRPIKIEEIIDCSHILHEQTKIIGLM